MNTKDVVIAVCFLLAALLCVFELFAGGFKAYYVSGAVLFTFVSSLFFRKANGRK